jgi:hypothetical protein
VTSVVLKYEAIVLLLAFLLVDWWFVTFRCSASPDIHGSHLGFGITVQVLIVATLLLVNRLYEDADDKFNLTAAATALALGLVSVVIVRDSILFGDSVDAERTSTSKGFQCPGAQTVFFLGHH